MNGASNYLQTPIGPALGRIAQQEAEAQIAKLGYDLPCSVIAVSGQIVTVKFEVNTPGRTLPTVTCPIIGAEYIRFPTQVGDKGVVRAADAYLGGVSGLGGGVATMTQQTNLSALVFEPIGNKGFTAVDGNAVVIYGPNGVVLRDTNSGAVVTLTPTGINCTVGDTIFVITAGSIKATTPLYQINAAEIELNGNVTQTAGTGIGTVSLLGPVTVINEVTAMNVGVATHRHSASGGTGDGGPPVVPS